MKLIRSVKARVSGGRLVLEEQTALPEGAEVRVEIVGVYPAGSERSGLERHARPPPGDAAVWEWLRAME